MKRHDLIKDLMKVAEKHHLIFESIDEYDTYTTAKFEYGEEKIKPTVVKL